ncbi:N-acetylneuraminate synthase [Rhizobium aethiopicum]|uniref:N-acetylneuraminate synthase n=1 Tax=Rhizobium aethiopicum TaxID=1138170 RepID=A0A7W6VS93_9HYPH|nr:N-acetylneuraminate synthase family protein [Rhizobium aethiopicum]MBB4195296.1 N-acetylneuraminate synthase [Rhizobium aethiopicum]MBB4584026.1 N-acetylneuraminate synthase [Rhizobium aethiopicum]
MKIEESQIGNGFPCFIIGEIAQAHDGSLGAAHAYIESVAKSGANSVKFQTHIAEAESTPDEKFRVKVFPQDATRYDYWRRMEFSKEQWAGLFDHARQKGLIFLSTPFSFEAVELLDRLGVPAWKVGSGEVGNLPMLEMMARTGKPILLSSGMSSWSDLDDAFAVIKKHGAEIALFQCTTAYPCPPDKIGLNLIGEMKLRYGVPVGLSDHSGTIYPSLSAVTLGANLIEVHTVFSKECFGPDVSASVTTKELQQLVDGIRFTEAMMMAPMDKDREAEEKKELSILFGKSLYCKTGLQKGHILTPQDIALKKPGTGMPARMLDNAVGKILKRDYLAGEQLKESDLDG